MATYLFLVILGVSVLATFFDWRRGWPLILLCGVLQDPARKLTPGSPVILSASVIAIYGGMFLAAYRLLQAHRQEFGRRFAAIYAAMAGLLFILALAAVNGLASYGLEYWKVPLFSLFTYIAPLPALLMGYVWVQREEMVYRYFRFFAVVTSIFLIGSLLEYFRVQSPALGLVSMPGDYIRHLPGIQIRMLSGFYRAPDIMAWHAGTLTAIGIAMSVRAGLDRRALPWIGVTAWGFLNCLMSGRRKAIYFVVAFAAAFMWRYFRRMHTTQIVAVVLTGLVLAGVVRQLGKGEQTAVYTRGARTTQTEVFQRLEGGMLGTFQQTGVFGAGLGAATQGVQHLLTGRNIIGWQEGGMGKLAVELGLPGLLLLAVIAKLFFSLALKLTSIPDVPGSSQILRVTLFALIVANIANFIGSAQAYSDTVLTLTTSFFIGAFFATATLDERLAASESASAPPAAMAAHAPA